MVRVGTVHAGWGFQDWGLWGTSCWTFLALLGENFIDRRLVWQAELCPDSDRPDHILRNLVVPVCVFRLTETV